MKIKQSTVNYACYATALILAYLIIVSYAYADPHHNNTYVTEVTEVTELTEVFNTYNDYAYDECNGVALSMAAASNQMYMGTKKPQISLGGGECRGEFAGSLMFGKMLNNGMLLNAAIAADENVEAFSINATWILK